MSPLLVLEHEPIAELGQDDIADLLIKLENDENRPMIDPATTIGRRFALPFYDDVTLIELRDPNWAPAGARLCFLETDEALERLDGTSPLIHKVNAQRGPILSRSTDETGYVQPTIEALIAARGTNSTYHNHAIQPWTIAESGEVTNALA